MKQEIRAKWSKIERANLEVIVGIMNINSFEGKSLCILAMCLGVQFDQRQWKRRAQCVRKYSNLNADPTAIRYIFSVGCQSIDMYTSC